MHLTDAAAVPQRVQLQSLDAFVADNRIHHITMVKSDTEGHDMTFPEGARETLPAGRIDVWQFEYNHRWLANRASLWRVFEFIEGLPYALGKLYGEGIERYDAWHFELDRFIETNYVLIRHGIPCEQLATTVHFDATNVPR